MLFLIRWTYDSWWLSKLGYFLRARRNMARMPPTWGMKAASPQTSRKAMKRCRWKVSRWGKKKRVCDACTWCYLLWCYSMLLHWFIISYIYIYTHMYITWFTWHYLISLDIIKTGWRLWPPTRAISPGRGSRLSKPIDRTHIAQPCLWRPRNHENYTLGFLFF